MADPAGGRCGALRSRIREHARYNAFINLTEEEGDGDVVAVKDVIDVAGVPTTAGSRILPDSPQPSDAAAIRSIRSGGAVVIGKTNLHEWAFGPTSINPYYGAVRNPADPSRIVGGSSGGSAAAVALGLCDWAIGTDTGGSVRTSAALADVVGFKPTLGVVPTTGVVPLSSTLDTLGVLARDAATAASAMSALTGLPMPRHGSGFDPQRLAVPAGWVTDLDETVGRAWASISWELPTVPFPLPSAMNDPGRTVLYYEAARFHSRYYPQLAPQYGDDVRRYLEEAFAIDEEAYTVASAALEPARDTVEHAMAGIDALVLPTTGCVAPTVQDVTSGRMPDFRHAVSRFARPFNTTGHPAITIPLPAPLPVGLQIVGHFGRDAELVALALSVEELIRGRR